MACAGLLSAFLANDIVCLAFTPILCAAILEARAEPRALPHRPGHGEQHRLGGDHHRQPAEHAAGAGGQARFRAFTRCVPAAGPAVAGRRLRDPVLALPQAAAGRAGYAGIRPDRGYAAFSRHQTAKGLGGGPGPGRPVPDPPAARAVGHRPGRRSCLQPAHEDPLPARTGRLAPDHPVLRAVHRHGRVRGRQAARST